ELRDTGQVIGGATPLPPPPDGEFEVGGQLVPRGGGHGYATEAGAAPAKGGVAGGVEEVVALGRATNTPPRAEVRRVGTGGVAMVGRIGMEWVGETEKYHGLRLQEYRLRPGDLTAPGW